ncbi:MAG TPA: hypothetical protein PKM73_19605 [Verrucomicrobiota bacterium]|nr:hypothetical protein [Verrucomicrobiota bacterium]HNU52488.1 hypothetical protein [Verrucomicrobiota bacterium]
MKPAVPRPKAVAPTADQQRDSAPARGPWLPWRTIAGAGALLLGLLLLARILPPGAQPAYEGRSVSEWADDLRSSDTLVREKARHAIRVLGTNAVPVLARVVARPDRLGAGWYLRNRRFFPARIARHLDQLFRPDATGRERTRAAVALRELGPRAEAAVPALALVLKRPSLTIDGQAAVLQAAYALAEIGPPGVPVLVEAIESAPWDQRALFLAAMSAAGTHVASAAPRLAALVARDPHPSLASRVGILMREAGLPGLAPFMDQLTTTDAAGQVRIAEVLVRWAAYDRAILAAVLERFAALPTHTRQTLMAGLQRLPADQPRLILFMATALADPDPTVKETAATWLTRHATLPQLEGLAARHAPEVLDAVRRVFAQPLTGPRSPHPPGAPPE